MRIIAYTYEADVHCCDCTSSRFGHHGRNTLIHPAGLPIKPIGLDLPDGWQHASHRLGADAQWHEIDEHGIDVSQQDREGNLIHPVFSTNEHDFTHCGDCGSSI